MTTIAHDKPDSVLLLLQGSAPSDHPGIVDGYVRLQQQGRVSHLDVMPVFGPNGVERGAGFWDEVLERALGHGTTVVVFQYYHSSRLPDPRPAIASLRTLPSSPFVVSTLGDPFRNGYFGRPSVPRSFLQAAEGSDLVTLTSMGVLADHVARYTRAPIVLSPNGVCQVRFAACSGVSPHSDPEFDVVFIGSRNTSKNPARPYFHLGRRRERLVSDLTKRFGKRFAVFGNGWAAQMSDQGPIPFAQQANTAERGRVIVGGVPFSRARYYTSNRPFIQMTSRRPLVDTAVPGVESMLRRDEHWILAPEWRLIDAVERVLEMGEEGRSKIGDAAAEYVRSRHTQAHRVASLMENVARLRLARSGGAPRPPYVPFFLPEADLTLETRHATRHWPGSAS